MQLPDVYFTAKHQFDLLPTRQKPQALDLEIAGQQDKRADTQQPRSCCRSRRAT